MPKLILIGGSFNPVHLGHLKMITIACSFKDVDKVVVMPAYCSPFKLQDEQIAATYRWQLLDLAINDLIDLNNDFRDISKDEQTVTKAAYLSKKLEVMDLEIRSDAPSYTWTTIKKLQVLYPGYEIILLGGSDLLADFEHWHAFREILRTVKLIIVTRPNYDYEKILRERNNLLAKYQAEIDLLTLDMPDISSAQLRAALKGLAPKAAYSLTASSVNNYYTYANLLTLFPKVCKDYLTKNECAFIAQNRLYTQPELASFLTNAEAKFVQALQTYILKKLPWNRQSHCLNVAYFALTLLIAYYQLDKLSGSEKTRQEKVGPTQVMHEQARQIIKAPFKNFNLSSLTKSEKQTCGKAIIAGLFHDACKYAKLADYPSVMASLSSEDKQSRIEHGPIAAYVLEHEFGCVDKEILEAVYYHTTLRPKATLLDKVVYLADKLEFGRTYEDVPSLRQSLILGYDETVKAVLRKTLALLEAKGQKAHSLSKQALAYLEEEKFENDSSRFS